MPDKENYFPPGTDINTINDTIYTDYSFMDMSEQFNVPHETLPTCDSKEPLEPPF